MSQCLNSDCLAINLATHQFCQRCGKSLRLKDRYQALKLIGQGGFGKTFLAIDHDKPSKPRCVIKQFFPQQEEGSEDIAKAEELFAAEAQRLEELGHHDQIPALLAYFTVEGRQHLVQEYVEGENLDEELKRLGAFDEGKIRQVLIDLLPVLDFIHQRQVIHRDIKPENIIRRASDQKLVLVDFGAAKQITPKDRFVTGTMIGSAEYMAPEQLNGKAVIASDLYSFGVTCLYLLVGLSPLDLFDSGEHEWIWRDCLNDKTISDDLAKVIDKMINLGIKKRYQSAKEILQELDIDLPSLIEKTVIEKTVHNSTQPVIFTSPNPDLKSPQNVDYTELRNLLRMGNWKGADRETGRLMCEIADRVKEEYLDEASIDGFPVEEMRNINKLWHYYSNGKFGFSVQAEIYRSLNGKRKINKKIWWNFCQKLGWLAGEEPNARWFGYSEVEFSIDAPVAHLPTPSFVLHGGWKNGAGWNNIGGQGLCGVLFSRASFVFFFSLSNNSTTIQRILNQPDTT